MCPAFFCSAPWDVFKSLKNGAQEKQRVDKSTHFTKIFKHLLDKFQIFFQRSTSFNQMYYVHDTLFCFGIVELTHGTSIDLGGITWCFQFSYPLLVWQMFTCGSRFWHQPFNKEFFGPKSPAMRSSNHQVYPPKEFWWTKKFGWIKIS